ncbi:DUF6503 family protein [Salinimicrobium catena]|uniref:DUF6503 family protein n=1 Tax=Salinimicrobium catena TaxID=390640 RepID=UPI000B882C41|nr:DUF6503 family protein [Salinimicrobium catena]
MKKFALLLLLIIFSSCNNEEKELTADAIIDKTIEKAGGERYKNAHVEFTFRNRSYTSDRNGGLYEFTRSFKDSLGEVKDVLNNEGLKRYREGEEVKISDSLATLYANSVNSVHYFVQLPYGLHDAAVQKELVGQDTISGKPYYEIRVTFAQEGGGADHEDVYMYWVNKEEFTIDYFAYRFYVNDGGIRFRVAKDPRKIEGIRFVNYDNYKTDDLSTPLEDLDDLYEEGKLMKISEINNEILNVEVK